MLKRLKPHLHRDMLRPLIYTVFSRGILALLAAQLIHFFAPENWPLRRFSNLALLLGALFALFSALAWLRMDGLGLPHFKLPRFKRKDPPFLTGDMADHLDDDIILFDDLDKEDQDVCALLADLILAAVCLLLALIV